jgi:hypothetical protein
MSEGVDPDSQGKGQNLRFTNHKSVIFPREKMFEQI